ncbi:hypothetical protein J6590_093439 [Homalodisca vitripennis]|nr:hypothetical protein J6590_070431 [Homalodisca vitripennis]KAG8265490.1 hypothetical protein J6590_093439 [Homalodisca vitripennis]
MTGPAKAEYAPGHRAEVGYLGYFMVRGLTSGVSYLRAFTGDTNAARKGTQKSSLKRVEDLAMAKYDRHFTLKINDDIRYDKLVMSMDRYAVGLSFTSYSSVGSSHHCLVHRPLSVQRQWIKFLTSSTRSGATGVFCVKEIRRKTNRFLLSGKSQQIVNILRGSLHQSLSCVHCPGSLDWPNGDASPILLLHTVTCYYVIIMLPQGEILRAFPILELSFLKNVEFLRLVK